MVCEEATRRIDEAERQCRRPLPGSVREWYSLREAVSLIPRWCHPRTLASVLSDFRSGGRIALGADGDCEWFVKPDGSDDPPVVVDQRFGLDDDGEHPYADRLAVLLFCWVWDGVTHEARLSATGFGVQVRLAAGAAVSGASIGDQQSLVLHQLPQQRGVAADDDGAAVWPADFLAVARRRQRHRPRHP